MCALLQRMTAWLCLAVAFLTGLAPAQGCVLCVQSDGRVGVDFATPAEHCQCCEDHEHIAAPEARSEHALCDSCCECLDLPVSGTLQDRLCKPRPITPQLGPWIPPSAVPLREALELRETNACVARVEAPRPPDSLALIRTVVLLL
ncbi:MAG: hypothetical protein IPJ19_20335 [Planctomycetes bacterium]|nr:hypothetical protein [Planctomycetota bacterium]